MQRRAQKCRRCWPAIRETLGRRPCWRASRRRMWLPFHAESCEDARDLPMSDEGLHEIQLNGKQLVFLFMTATVVAVVIFLCGVMVGRGVPAQRGMPVLAADGSDPTTTDEVRSAASATDTAATPSAASSPSASPSSKLDLTYPNR